MTQKPNEQDLKRLMRFRKARRVLDAQGFGSMYSGETFAASQTVGEHITKVRSKRTQEALRAIRRETNNAIRDLAKALGDILDTLPEPEVRCEEEEAPSGS